MEQKREFLRRLTMAEQGEWLALVQEAMDYSTAAVCCKKWFWMMRLCSCRRTRGASTHITKEINLVL